MPKASTPVERPRLEAAIHQAEKDGPLRNLHELWKRAAEIYNRTALRAITFSLANLRAKEWNIPIKTTGGHRGPLTEEHKAALLAARGKRAPRAEKMRGFTTFSLLRQELGSKLRTRKYLPVVDAAEDGSIKAAIKLKCLECSNYQTEEVRLCPVTDCALFPHRPYQGSEAEPCSAS